MAVALKSKQPSEQERIDMPTQDLLKIMRLLSALESWAFSTNHLLPDYLLDDLNAMVARIETEILKAKP